MPQHDAWTTFYRSIHGVGSELAFPSETLVRLLKGTYVPDMPKDFCSMSVIDVGCGNGNNTMFLATLGFAVSAVELSEEICAMVRQKLSGQGLSADVRVGTNRNLPFNNDIFDFLVSWNVLHYEAEESNVEAAIREYARVLRPGGRLFLSTTGPTHKILDGSETLGQHRYLIGRADDFRKGSQHFLFDAPNYIAYYFGKAFANVRVGRVTNTLFTQTLDWFIVTAIKT